MFNKKGISLIALIVMIVVMLIISSMLIYNGMNNKKVENLTKLKADIGLLKDSVDLYYLKNKTLPVQFENEFKKVLNSNQIIEELGTERNEKDNDVYYILEVNLLENITFTRKYEEGKFIVNEQSHNIYYIEGLY